MTEIGKGSRRVCLRMPDALLCVKRYRDDGEVGETVRKEIERCKFDRRRNTCAQEYDYIRSLEKILSHETLAVFPEKMELKKDPVHGWHLVESLVLNGDGSVPERFSRTCRAANANMRRRLLAAFRNLAHAFEAAAVRFYDPQNVLVQWSGKPFESDFRLRIVDFEPASRAFLPIDLLFSALRRMKLRRRVKRYLWQHVAAKYNPLPWRKRAAWDALVKEEGAKIGLSRCCAFLENKLVNDIFYEGVFKGRPCVVKCSSRAPESIENEYKLASRLNALDPVHFPEVYAFSPGPMAFVVTERIEGGKTLADEPDDKYADEVLAIIDSLYEAKVVYRDILPANFLVAPDGHLKLIDFQFAVDWNDRRIDPWLERHPAYHYTVFAGVLQKGVAWWDDADFSTLLLPSLDKSARSRIGRLRLEIPLSAGVRARLALIAFGMRLQRLFTRCGSRKRQSIDRRLERFSWLSSS